MALDTLPNSETRQILDRIAYLLNILAQWLIGFLTIYMSWLCLRLGLVKTALHAWLVTIGFVFLTAEGVMVHYNANVLTFTYHRSAKTTIHWILQTLGGSLGCIGVLIKCAQKGFLLQSVHGKLGFVTFVFCVISMLSGLSALYSARLKERFSPLLNKTLHNILGLITFALAMITQIYGYKTKFFCRQVTEDFRLTMEILTLATLLLTCIGPCKVLYYKYKNIVRHFK